MSTQMGTGDFSSTWMSYDHYRPVSGGRAGWREGVISVLRAGRSGVLSTSPRHVGGWLDFPFCGGGN